MLTALGFESCHTLARTAALTCGPRLLMGQRAYEQVSGFVVAELAD